MLIYTCEQMRVIEENADVNGLSYVEMMENAGNACAEKIHSTIVGLNSAAKTVAVLCGSGKNGGDGFVIAKNLSDKGYGIRAAVWAGANLDKEAAPMLFDRGVVAPGVDGGYVDSDTAFGGKAFPGTIRQYNPGTQPFLKVNRNGERFANESCPYNDIVYAAAHQPGRVYAQICDANILEDAKRFHTIGCSAQTRNGGEKYIQGKMDEAIEAGALFKCDTLDELADKMGFTGAAKDTFLATVERYNELYDKQNDEDFGKPAYRLSAIRTAPFYGCWLGASLLTTEQGIAINEKGQALDTNNQPMEGLYITGDMSGSFFANNYPCLMAGVAMGRTLTFAMKAIKQMAGLENA